MKLNSIKRYENTGIVEFEFEGKEVVLEFPIDYMEWEPLGNPPRPSRSYSPTGMPPYAKQSLNMEDQLFLCAQKAVANYFLAHIFEEKTALNKLKQ